MLMAVLFIAMAIFCAATSNPIGAIVMGICAGINIAGAAIRSNRNRS